jgi:hypothetical protein
LNGAFAEATPFMVLVPLATQIKENIALRLKEQKDLRDKSKQQTLKEGS